MTSYVAGRSCIDLEPDRGAVAAGGAGRDRVVRSPQAVVGSARHAARGSGSSTVQLTDKAIRTGRAIVPSSQRRTDASAARAAARSSPRAAVGAGRSRSCSPPQAHSPTASSNAGATRNRVVITSRPSWAGAWIRNPSEVERGPRERVMRLTLPGRRVVLALRHPASVASGQRYVAVYGNTRSACRSPSSTAPSVFSDVRGPARTPASSRTATQCSSSRTIPRSSIACSATAARTG
jgi:hypothetical protein